MNRKSVGLLFCIALFGGMTLLAGCARDHGTMNPKFADTESTTVQPADEGTMARRDTGSRMGEGMESGLDEGGLPLNMDEKTARDTLFAQAREELQTIYFDYDKSDLKAEAKAKLERAAHWLKANPQVNCRVEGHCDERGTNEYNLSLGERRALAARRYLVSLGVNPDQIFTISYGEERPAVEGHDESAWKFNRRDEFKVGL